MDSLLTRDEIRALLDTKTPQELRALEHGFKAQAVRPLPDTEYQQDPVGWATKVLGIPANTIRWSLNEGYKSHTWDGTPDPLSAIAEAIANGEDVGVESSTGVGKTFAGAWIALWFLACFDDAIVITTAPKKDQLTTQLWKEIGKQLPRFQKAYPKTSNVELRVRMKEGKGESESWAIIGYACGVDAGSESATRAQGFHSAHMLIITEETPGIDNAVMAALANTCTGDHNIRLALGNPDSQLDELHKFCTTEDVTHIRISSFDHPNIVSGQEVIPGATSPKGIKKLKAQWGEGTPMYESRVRGISPSESVDALIKLEWLKAAVERWIERPPFSRKANVALGVDVANSINGDKAAIATWYGSTLESVRSFACPDSNQLGRDIHAQMQIDGVSPYHVGVDSIGVGAGTVNTLRELTGGYETGLNSGSSAISNSAKSESGQTYEWVPDSNLFSNLRGQMYWQMREDLRLGQVAMPNDPELFQELTMPTYKIQGGKVYVEAKDAIKKRMGGKSPDKADAVVYGNWVRYRGQITSQDVQENYHGRDRTVFEPLDEDDMYETNTGTGQSFGRGW